MFIRILKFERKKLLILFMKGWNGFIYNPRFYVDFFTDEDKFNVFFEDTGINLKINF